MPTDMERQLAEKDRQLAELTEQVSKLTAELGRARLGGGYGSRGALSRGRAARAREPGAPADVGDDAGAGARGRRDGAAVVVAPRSPGQPHFFHASSAAGR